MKIASNALPILITFTAILCCAASSKNSREIWRLPLPNQAELLSLRNQLSQLEVEAREDSTAGELVIDAPHDRHYHKIFNHIFKEMTRGLEAKALAQVNSMKTRFVHTSKLSYYDNLRNEAFIDLPEILFGRVSELAIRAHELGHAVQAAKLGREKKWAEMLTRFYAVSTYAKQKFAAERHSMNWEWAALYALPEKVLKDERAFVAANKARFKSRSMYQLLLEMLDNGHLDRREYIKNQWKRGRYSRQKIVYFTYGQNLAAGCQTFAVMKILHYLSTTM